MELNLIIAGQAGQGVQLVSEVLGRALVRGGYYVFASMDAMSRIRGGHNFSRVRVSDKPVGADTDKAQLLVALDPAHVALHASDLEKYAVVLTDDSVELERSPEYQLVQLPLARLAAEFGKSRVMQNMVAAGATLGILNCEPALLVEVVKERMSARGQDAADRNVACVRQGYDLVRRRARMGTLARLKPVQSGSSRLFLSGAQAIALGAIAGGVRLVAGYPMSPATPVLEACAARREKAGLVVEQPEDGIAAVNMAIGASFAGALGMVATAGGGMCLMNEALSLAGMTETPLVLCSGMRPGPATGLATRTEQADLLFAVSCGHGEFPRAVLCPADAAQAFGATMRACRIAVKYQTPAIVLFDQFMGDALWTADEFDIRAQAQAQAQARDTGPYSYKRYQVTEGGVSPILKPGTREQLVYVDSDEHTVEGHITESAEVRRQMVDKRLAKVKGIAAELEPPERYPDEDAETMVFCFGSTKGVVKEAVDKLQNTGRGVGMVHLCDIWPFPSQRVMELAGRAKRLLTVENNSTGQLAQLLAQECRLRVAGTVGKYDGRPFSVGDVERGIRKLLE